MSYIKALNKISKILKVFSYRFSLILRECFPRYKFKLIGIKSSAKCGHEVCIIQLTGKNVFPEIEAKHLIQNPALLRDFAPEDIITITRLADKISKYNEVDTYCIKEFSSETSDSKDNIIIENIGKGTFKVIDIKQIDTDISVVDKFSSREAYILGRRRERINNIDEKNAIRALKESKDKRQFYIV